MRNRIQEIFDPIQAEDSLKSATTAFIHEKISNRSQTATFRPAFRLRYVVAVICILFMAALGIGGYSIWNTPVSFISIDVNPSVELGLNRFDRIVSVTAYNDDGAIVLSDVDLTGLDYASAIDTLVESDAMHTYITEAEAALTITVVSDHEDDLLEGIQQCGSYSEYQPTCKTADAEIIEDAHQCGLSLGKYNAYLTLKKYTDTITAEDCQHMTMREIRDLISQYSNDEETTTEANTSSTGNDNCNNSSNGTQQSGNGAQQSGSGLHQSGNGAQQSDSGSNQSGNGAQQTGTGTQQMGNCTQQTENDTQQVEKGAHQSGSGNHRSEKE